MLYLLPSYACLSLVEAHSWHFEFLPAMEGGFIIIYSGIRRKSLFYLKKSLLAQRYTR